MQSLRDLGRLEAAIGPKGLADYLDSIGQQQLDSKAKKKAGEGGQKVDLRAFNALEAVRSGMPFALRVAVRATTPAHLGLMILAMQKFLISGQVGGKAARGFGQFVCDASQLLEIDAATGTVVRKVPLFGLRSDGYTLSDEATVQQASVAAQDFLDQADAALYAAFAQGNPALVAMLGGQGKGRGKAAARPAAEALAA